MSLSHTHYLSIAARLALRGRGGAEPNPLVGCVVVAPDDTIVGWGYHRRCGDAHAEIVALNRAGNKARGATVYVTLEPCCHQGRTGPCTQALIDAGVAKVIFARSDPNPESGGGEQQLRDAGIEALHEPKCPNAIAVSDPFVHRMNTGLPWVSAKWAQTIDGRIATRTGKSQWISNAPSRRLVHRRRGQVDAILTGIGTVIADDPLLTARDVRARRIARRVIVDPMLKTPINARIVTTCRTTPTTIVCDEKLLKSDNSLVKELENAGVELLGIPTMHDELSLELLLKRLVDQHDIATVLVEAGAGLLGRLFQLKLVNEAWVFIAPMLFGDDQATPPVNGMTVNELTDGAALKLMLTRRRDDDVILHYRMES